MLIHTAKDARDDKLNGRSLVPSPIEYDGSLDEFIHKYVLPNLPSRDVVAAFHSALILYLEEPNPLLLLRQVGDTERRYTYQTSDGIRFRATDNAPAWWLHATLVQEHRIARDAFAEVVATIPTHMFDVAASTGPTASAAGWHIAHIFDVKDGNTDYKQWSRAEVVDRFVRNIHPCNYFLIAKTEWHRWGGDKRVIGSFAALYAERYSDVWPEFLRLARAHEATLVRISGQISYRYSAQEPKTRGPERIKPRVIREPVRSAYVPSGHASVTYSASRLTFKRDVIEPLDDDDAFSVVTPIGTFQMTKAEFYETFPNVPLTNSYQHVGIYHYPTLPRAAARFQIKVPITD